MVLSKELQDLEYQKFVEKDGKVMTRQFSTSFLTEVAKGNVPGHSYIHKFGRNDAVGTSLIPICNGGNYQTPTSAQALEILSSSANDAAAGTGARKVVIQGLNASCAEINEEVTLNGTTPVALSTQFFRIFRVFVSESGSYANQSTPSQLGTITIRGAGGGDTWVTIPLLNSTFGVAQSLIGAYTVPAGKTAYILSQTITVDSGKSATVVFFKRENVDTVSAPFEPLRAQNIYTGLTGFHEMLHITNESYPEKTDMGFMGFMSTGTGDISVEFELLLVDN